MLFSIGRSFEGRRIYGVKISNDLNSGVKPTIFIDAGIHAREWIAPATALYLIRKLSLLASLNDTITQNIDYYIVPLVNPDGYEYSHEQVKILILF